MTPYELSLHCEAFTERLAAKQEEQISLVWLGEYYHRVKKLPSLKEVLRDIKQDSKKEMSEEEMKKMVRQINAQLGGKVETKKV